MNQQYTLQESLLQRPVFPSHTFSTNLSPVPLSTNYFYQPDGTKCVHTVVYVPYAAHGNQVQPPQHSSTEAPQQQPPNTLTTKNLVFLYIALVLEFLLSAGILLVVGLFATYFFSRDLIHWAVWLLTVTGKSLLLVGCVLSLISLPTIRYGNLSACRLVSVIGFGFFLAAAVTMLAIQVMTPDFLSDSGSFLRSQENLGIALSIISASLAVDLLVCLTLTIFLKKATPRCYKQSHHLVEK
eukprot:TRINITY_DN1040_c0_g1_i4.p2 TRINITY_DN1040_c0_g1~~TRINITY_DN1040_c0_g1_i4.p2  ORF type:complete len:252 (+),score=25.58 TRINITY_DN1040_c0_g1_i4:39-758(+)